MKVKSICFDLGDTLINSGHPLSWSSNYKKALGKGFLSINKLSTDYDLNNCLKILTKYNTRENPREIEISSDKIFNEIKDILGINSSKKDTFENEFFEYFLQSSELYDDVEEVLVDIKNCNIKTGILTDVPYGRKKGFIADDVEVINKNIDIILSSVDIGFRKPNITGYLILAEKLETNVNEMIYVGNEEKDIIGANNAGIVSVLINRTDKRINYGEKYQFKCLKEMWYYIKRQTIA